jgi:exonuclease III
MNFGIIGLVETWLKDKPHDYFKLKGYNMEFQNRPKKGGGGVCLHIKDNIKYHVRNDLEQIKHPENVETLFIEIEKTGSKNIVIGVVYRPPDQCVTEFNDFFDTLLTTVTKNGKLVYLMGDFNINLLNGDVHSPTNDFINVLTSNSLYPSITKPTRITSKSATLIDNIFTNSKAHQTSGIVLSDLSDHLPIFITTDLNVFRRENSSKETDVRHFTEQNMNYFKTELNKVDWDIVCHSNNVDESYTKFIDKFNELYDKCIPKRKKRAHSQKNKPKSPWITNALLKSIRRKNILYNNSLKKTTDVNIVKYKKYRNKLNSTLRLAKQNYFCDLLEKEKNNMRNTWKVLNSILRPKTNTNCETFTSGNKTYTCPIQIATEFNKYFASIGSSLASSIQHSGKDFSSYLQNSNSMSCFFRPTDQDEIIKLISKLGSRKVLVMMKSSPKL